MSRVTHEAEIEFGLDPDDEQSTMTVRMKAEKTASAYPGHFDRVTGDADPGGPDEFDIISVELFDHQRGEFVALSKVLWEAMFGLNSWGTLLDFLQGELQEID